jgi:RHS repeat-associated protein
MHLSNHLGNVLVTVSDRKLTEGTEGSTASGYRAEVLFASDYYPFGMQMPGREFSDVSAYRYGFQGQETDKEWLGGAVSYKYRVHDARIGRFLSVDPLARDYPHNSPYAFAENKVISHFELEGLEGVNAVDHETEVTTLEINLVYVSQELNPEFKKAVSCDELQIFENTILDEFEKGTDNKDLRYQKEDGTFYDVKLKINFFEASTLKEAVEIRELDPDGSALFLNDEPVIRNFGTSFSPGSASKGVLHFSSASDGHSNLHELFHLFVHYGSNAPETVHDGFDPNNQGPWHKRWTGIFTYGFPMQHVNQKNVTDAILHTPILVMSLPASFERFLIPMK